MAPREDGERAERLTGTLFGAIDGGQHCGARIGVDEFASHETTLRELRFQRRVDGPLTLKP